MLGSIQLESVIQYLSVDNFCHWHSYDALQMPDWQSTLAIAHAMAQLVVHVMENGNYGTCYGTY